MQRNIRIWTRCVAIAGLVSNVSAAPYNGNGPGTSTIDAAGGGDYTSLQSALAAINGTPLTGGDWEFLIASDLTENAKLALGQNTNGNSLIFKPAPATQPTITFETTETTSLGWGGHWIIGTATKNSHLANIATHNVIIDGSNNGTTSRDLTIANVANGNDISLVVVVSDCDGFQIRNCNIVNNSSSTQAGIRLASINDIGFVNLSPDNAVIENCSITAIGANSRGIQINRNGASTQTVAADGTVINNNDISVGGLAISATEFRDLTVTGNTILVSSNATSGSATGIQLSGGTIASEAIEVVIENNEITGVSRAIDSSGSLRGFEVSGSVGAGAPSPLVRIHNNAVSVQATSASVTPTLTRASGIQIALTDADTEVWHNSISVFVPSTYTVTSPGSSAGLLLSGVTASAAFDLQNNIVRFEGPAGYAISRNATAGTWISDYNNLIVIGGTAFGNNAGAPAATSSNWVFDTGLDPTSTDADPTVLPPGSGTWTSLTNLRFNNPPTFEFGGFPIAGITTDLEGTVRDGSMPFKGAFEGSGYFLASVKDWRLLE